VTRWSRLDGSGRPLRLVPETAGDGLLLRVPRTADWPGRFALDQHANRIDFERGLAPGGGVAKQRGGELTLRFMAMPIAP
jgi:hypothetical protein